MTRCCGISIERHACILAALLICGGGIAACVGISAADESEGARTPAAIVQPAIDGECPELSGDYRETGDGRYSNGKTFVAHLMENAFAESFYRTRSTKDHEALVVRVFHAAPGTVHMQAIVGNELVGQRELRGSDGWYCSQKRLVKFRASPFNIEAGRGTQVDLHTIYVSADREICFTQDWKMQYVFGGPGGDPGYRLTACFARKSP